MSTLTPDTVLEEPVTRDGDLSVRAYRSIREAIVNLTFQPGDPLRETALARWLEVSRTPIREALRRLQGEGFVSLDGTRGFVVAQVSVEDIEHAYFVIEVLEGLAARTAAARKTPEDEIDLKRIADGLKLAADSGDLESWTRLDAEFHECVRAIAANPKLSQTSAMAYSVIERVRHMHLREHPEPDRLERETAVHCSIADAIIRGDGADAENQMRELFGHARIDNVRLLRHWIVPLRRSF